MSDCSYEPPARHLIVQLQFGVGMARIRVSGGRDGRCCRRLSIPPVVKGNSEVQADQMAKFQIQNDMVSSSVSKCVPVCVG